MGAMLESQTQLNMKTIIAESGLIGRWQTEDADSQAIVEVSENHGKPQVVAYDKKTGEKFKITMVRFKNGVLSYNCQVLSTACKTRHKLAAVSNKGLKHELTFYEVWRRQQNEATDAGGMPTAAF